MTKADRGPDGLEAETTPQGWSRRKWLAEKVKSGELPAAAGEMTKKCDALFVAKGGIEGHVELMAKFLTGEVGETKSDTERRLADLRGYLERLLSVREMWARERS